MNLPDGLANEARRIWQLVANAGTFHYGRDPAPATFDYDWTAADDVIYWLKPRNARYLRLFNIAPKSFGHFDLTEERTEASTPERERIGYEVREGERFEQEIEHTFGKTETLQDAVREAFGTAVKARLGAASAPAGLELAATAERETSRTQIDQGSQQLRIAQKYAFDGPAKGHFLVERMSERVTVRGRVKPHWDYGIDIGFRYADGGSSWMEFASKAEFLDLIKGRASDDKGIFHSGVNAPISLASHFRQHAQPGATIDDSAAPIEWVSPFTRVLDLSISRA